jgi:hypothetical protein
MASHIHRTYNLQLEAHRKYTLPSPRSIFLKSRVFVWLWGADVGHFPARSCKVVQALERGDLDGEGKDGRRLIVL